MDPKETGMKQLSLAETEARPKPWDINDPRAIHVHHKIAEMMALDIQSFQTGILQNCLRPWSPKTHCQVAATLLRMLSLVLQVLSIQS